MAENVRYFDNWIDGYLQYTLKQESPNSFHWWCAVSTIASALGRRCFMNRGYYVLYPNMYVVLVAESALCRKSTSTRLSSELLKYTGIDVVTEKLTVPYLYRHLATSSKGKSEAAILIYAPELAVFLGKDAHSSGLIATITSLYDCPKVTEYRTKSAGVDIIHNPVVNILGATTLDWMSTNLPGESVEGGFTSRVLFIVEEEPRMRIAWPEVTQTELDLKQQLITDLNIIHSYGGAFNVTPEARELFNTWYIEAKEPEDPRLRGFFGRKGDHILKTAMILSIATRDDLLLDALHVEWAIEAVEEAEKRMPIAFRGVAFSKTAKDVDRILHQLEKLGGSAEHSKLLKKNSCYLNAKEFNEVINTLLESEQVVRYADPATGKKMYIMNKK